MVIAYGKFSLKALAKALYSTAKMSAMILIMIAFLQLLRRGVLRLGGATFISNQLLSMHLSPMVMLAIILIIIFFMGWAMEWIPIILILVPLTLPVVDAMGYDKLWYCMLVAVTLQTSWLSPPWRFRPTISKARCRTGKSPTSTRACSSISDARSWACC